jgi:hypothetical protein
MVQSLATLRQTVEQMAADQDELKRDIVQMHSALIDVLVKIPEPLRQPPAAAERKSVPAARRHRGPRQGRHSHKYHLSSNGLIPAFVVVHAGRMPPFTALVRLSRTSIADEMREEHHRRALGE